MYIVQARSAAGAVSFFFSLSTLYVHVPGISLLNYFFQFLQPMGWVGRIHVCMFMCARTEVVLTISRASYDGAVSYAAANCSWCSIPLRLTLQSLARRVLCDGGVFFAAVISCYRLFCLVACLLYCMTRVLPA